MAFKTFTVQMGLGIFRYFFRIKLARLSWGIVQVETRVKNALVT